MGEHDALGLAGRAARRHDQGVAVARRVGRRRGRCSAPSASRTTVTARAASCAALAGGGSRWSIGKAASPSSHARVRASTNAGPAGRSRATSWPVIASGPGDAVRRRVALGASRRPSCPAMWCDRQWARGGREPLDRRGTAADAAGGDRAGGPRGRVRGRRRSDLVVAGRPGARRQPRPAGRRELRQRLLRRRARHRRRAGRPGAPGGVGAGDAGGGEAGGVVAFAVAAVRRPGARGVDVVVAARRRRGEHRRGVGLHRRAAAVRLPRARRGVRVRVLRARRHGRARRTSASRRSPG